MQPILTYGIELWEAAKPTNIQRIQAFQSKTTDPYGLNK